MQRYCFVMYLKPGMEAEYRRRHDEIWPQLVEAIGAAGIQNYSLFRRGLQVIAYCECEPDGPTAFARVGETDVDARWSAWFADVLERVADDDGRPLVAHEVWHLD